MLLVGTNNVETNTPTQIIEKYKNLTDAIQRENKKVKVICFEIPPRPNDYNKLNDRVTSFNTLLKKLAREKQYTFVNIYKTYMSHGGPTRALFAMDGLHFSKGGNKKLRQIVQMVAAGH